MKDWKKPVETQHIMVMSYLDVDHGYQDKNVVYVEIKTMMVKHIMYVVKVWNAMVMYYE